MAIIIFGGLGHVGSWVAHDLVERGEEVVIFDMNANQFNNLGLDYLAPYRDKLHIEAVDVMDTHTIFEKMKVYEGNIEAVIFGVAVIAGPDFQKRPFKNIQTNTVGMLNVIDICRVLQVNKFINLSSGAVYGDKAKELNELSAYKATDLYAATKIANEVLALQYGATYDLDVRNARLYFIYGPGRLPSRMHLLYQAMFGALEGLTNISSSNGGDQALDWTHVRDAAQGIIKLMDAKNCAGESFNISSGVPVQHRDLVKYTAEIVGQDCNMKLGDGMFTPRGTPLDIDKAKEKLQFNPKYTDIKAGLKDYKKWLDSRK